MKKFVNILLGILLIALGIGAGYIHITSIVNNNLNFFDGAKVTLITNVVLVVFTFIITNIIFRINIQKIKNDDMKPLECLALIPYILVIFIYSFISIKNSTHNGGIISNIIMSGILTCVYAFLPILMVSIGTYPPLTPEEKAAKKAKNKRITATTYNWSDNLSTTTYRDEDGNETKIDHWKF